MYHLFIIFILYLQQCNNKKKMCCVLNYLMSVAFSFSNCKKITMILLLESAYCSLLVLLYVPYLTLFFVHHTYILSVFSNCFTICSTYCTLLTVHALFMDIFTLLIKRLNSLSLSLSLILLLRFTIQISLTYSSYETGN